MRVVLGPRSDPDMAQAKRRRLGGKVPELLDQYLIHLIELVRLPPQTPSVPGPGPGPGPVPATGSKVTRGVSQSVSAYAISSTKATTACVLTGAASVNTRSTST